MNVRLKPPQFKVFRCAERFRVLVAGRRFGKTYLALVELCRVAFQKDKKAKAWYVAPTSSVATFDWRSMGSQEWAERRSMPGLRRPIRRAS